MFGAEFINPRGVRPVCSFTPWFNVNTEIIAQNLEKTAKFTQRILKRFEGIFTFVLGGWKIGF